MECQTIVLLQIFAGKKQKSIGTETRTPAIKLPFHFSFLYSKAGSPSVRKQRGRVMLCNIMGRLYESLWEMKSEISLFFLVWFLCLQ